MTRTLVLAAALGGGTVAGCGYTVGPLLPDGARSVALAFAENLTDRRDLEWTLTEALGRELQARGFTLVLAGDADAVCHVRLRDARERATAEDTRDAVVQGGLTLEADVVLRDRRGRTVVERRGLRETGTYLVAAGQDEGTAADRAVRALARRIAEALVPGF